MQHLKRLIFPIYDKLKDIGCKSIGLCNDDTCLKCYNESFASVGYGRPQAWSLENDKTPREVYKSSRTSYWFDCPSGCGHRFLREIWDVVQAINVAKKKDSGEVPPFQCVACGRYNLCEDDTCQFCFQASFASHPMASLWSYHEIDGKKLNGNWTPKHLFPNSSFEAWLQCSRCSGLINKKLNDFTKSAAAKVNPLDINCRHCGKL